jgi:hypothetical protein
MRSSVHHPASQRSSRKTRKQSELFRAVTICCVHAVGADEEAKLAPPSCAEHALVRNLFWLKTPA